MIFSKVKNLKARNLFNKKEIKKKINKFLFINFLNNKLYTKKDKKLFLSFFFKKSKKAFNSSQTKITSRCLLTNRSHGVYKSFGLSRIALRELMQFGIVPGYSKAVW